MGSTLFVCGQDMSKFVTVFVKGIVDIYDLSSRVAEYDFAPLFNKRFYDNVGT